MLFKNCCNSLTSWWQFFNEENLQCQDFRAVLQINIYVFLYNFVKLLYYAFLIGSTFCCGVTEAGRRIPNFIT